MERFGPFLLHESLGGSDVKAVHRAELTGLDGRPMQVVLRRLDPAAAQNQDIAGRFVREAQIGLYLQHPNVARTFELASIENVVFVAGEHVPGKSLAQLMADRAKPIPVPIVLAILGQVCDALEFAHGLRDPQGQPLGLLHGELVPGHVLVGDTGVVKLIGFGRMEPHQSKLAYMAPEFLATGMRDARADLWALGVIAHELLANQPLFSGANDTEIVTAIHKLQIQPPSSFNTAVPTDIDGIVLMALSREPGYRWQYAGQLREGLRASIERNQLALGPDQIAAWLRQPAEKQVAIERPGEPEPVDDQPTEQPAVKPAPAATPLPGKTRPPMVLKGRPPSLGDMWTDHTDEATQIRKMDSEMAALTDEPVVEVVPPDAPDDGVEVGVEVGDDAPKPAKSGRLPTEGPVDLESFMDGGSAPSLEAAAAAFDPPPPKAKPKPVEDSAIDLNAFMGSDDKGPVSPTASTELLSAQQPPPDEPAGVFMKFRTPPKPAPATPLAPGDSAIDLNALMAGGTPAGSPNVSPTASTEPATPLLFGDDDADDENPAKRYPRPLTIDFGPEPTAIGAIPLISSAQSAPLQALVGERPAVQRSAALPPISEAPKPLSQAGGVALAGASTGDDEPKAKSRRWLWIAIAAVAAIGIAVALVFALGVVD